MGGYVQGTTHSTYLKKKGADRNRKKCLHFHDNGLCGSASKCIGSSQCQMYMTDRQYIKLKKKKSDL